MTIIYKVCRRSAWEKAVQLGEFAGAEIDVTDGFIHFSAGHQVVETVGKHFAGQDDLLLVSVNADSLGPDLKWEPSRGADLFPHLYSALPMDKAVRVDELPLGDDGRHVFPSDLSF